MSPAAPPAGSTRPVRFVHRGQIAEVDGPSPTTTVLQWLREHARCTGTKEGCAEGDCGACTVIVAEPAPAGSAAAGSAGSGSAVVDGLLLRTVNACIQFLPTLDGRALLTVEDLRGITGGQLHPAQQALVQCHGSQCGFCTPGFAMSLACAYEHHAAAGTQPTRPELADALAGNLCRCTGYRPILDAGQQMFELPPARLDTAALKTQLEKLAEDPPLTYSAANPAVTGADGQPRIDRFHAPRSLDQLALLRAALPQARLLAGSTDIGLWVTKQFRDLGEIIDLTHVAELKHIGEQGGSLWIGAGASLEDAWAAICRQAPGLKELWLRFASPPIRHAGTLGGNLANGSPIGDGPPALMALDAVLVLRHGGSRREIALREFYLDYMKNQMAEGEFLEAVRVPLAQPQHVRGYKVSKRYDSDISAVCGAFALSLDQGQVSEARLAFGGLAAIVKRSALAEAAIVGQPWTEATVRAGMAALAQEFKPLSDMRSTAGYRLRVAQNLLQRLWLETREQSPLPAPQTTVWDAARALAP
ncbi:MAG: xanthine dehydrogenase small subunit [Aquabacterium sp.]|nr:MAG: xanthine dehydrogenase small subunit [Aquabacterium sp.]